MIPPPLRLQLLSRTLIYKRILISKAMTFRNPLLTNEGALFLKPDTYWLFGVDLRLARREKNQALPAGGILHSS
jgi:hypothetical protein